MRTTTLPVVTVAVPSYNHGRFLDEALTSIFDQGIPVEVMLADGGSNDETLQIIRRWKGKLAWWRSSHDAGQSAAINEAIGRGKAPYVCWLNADDTFLRGGLQAMVAALESHPDAPAIYAKCWTTNAAGKRLMPYVTHSFSVQMLASRCFIAQPATLIRRSAWEKVGGVDEGLHFAFDYDLWWRLYKADGKFAYLRKYAATTRAHLDTKTAGQRKKHVLEAMRIVRRHFGRVPMKWYLTWPYSIWARKIYHQVFSNKSAGI